MKITPLSAPTALAALTTALAAAVAALLAAGPAAAQMTAAEFEAYVTGKTLTYSDRGITYGIEEYLPGRRVRWAFDGDTCEEGIWYESSGGDICFVYDHKPDDPQCWEFTRRGGRLVARHTNSENGRELYEAAQSTEPLYCPGPDVGV